MKSRTPHSPSSQRGFTVRFAADDMAVLEQLSELVSNGTVNRLLVLVVLEILHLCQSSPFSLPPNSALRKLLSHSQYKAQWRQLAERDLRRTLPNSASKPIKLTFPDLERQRLGNLSRQLEWAGGQIILSALQAFCAFAGAERPLEDLPAIIQLSRGGRLLMGGSPPESGEMILACLNIELGLVTRPRLDPPEAPEQPMEIEVDLI